MKRLVLALLASSALAFPAFAAPNTTPAQQPQTQQQSQMQRPQQNAQNPSGRNQQQAANRIRPNTLSRKDVREIQMALNKKGFQAGHVDGIWGRDTMAAVQHFQKVNHIAADGHLTHRTLSDLGVQVAANQNNMNNGNMSQDNGGMGRNGSQNMSGSQSPNGSQNTNGGK